MYKYQLPKDFATKWVEALRSGNYKQGQNVLCDYHDRYCCIGVAGVLGGAKIKYLIYRQWIQFNSTIDVPSLLKGTGAQSDLVFDLSDLNDRENKSFSEIADWIEANVEFVESEAQNV